MTNVRGLLNHFRSFSGTEAGDGGNGDATSSGGGLTPPPGDPGTFNAVYGSFAFVNSGNISPILPSGSAGQLMVVGIGFRGSGTFTAPAGWTEIAQYAPVIGTGTGGATGVFMAYRVRQAGDATPTFTRTGGSDATSFVVGYDGTGRTTPTVLDGYSLTSTTSAEPTVYGNAISPVAESLLVTVSATSYFTSVLDTSFTADNISALVPDGVLTVPGTPVLATQWKQSYFASLNGADDVHTSSFHFLHVAGGDTGQFTHNAQGGSCPNAMIVAAFKAP